MDKDYKRVACDFYDSLESIATFNQQIQISYRTTKGVRVTKPAFIQTLETKDKSEFVILQDGDKIRLDYIYTLKVI